MLVNDTAGYSQPITFPDSVATTYHALSSVVCTFYHKNRDKILGAHCTWKAV